MKEFFVITKEICDKCKGSGLIDEDICPACAGAGSYSYRTPLELAIADILADGRLANDGTKLSPAPVGRTIGGSISKGEGECALGNYETSIYAPGRGAVRSAGERPEWPGPRHTPQSGNSGEGSTPLTSGCSKGGKS